MTHERTVRNAAVVGGRSATIESGWSLELLVDGLAAGMTPAEILCEHPECTVADVGAAEAYARAHAHEVPKALLASVVAYFDPVKVILFGSRARGDARSDSDYDLLVVLDDQVADHRLRWQAPYEARRGFSGAVDIVRCRRSVYEDQREVIGSLAHSAAEEGIVVYEGT
ncbi:MAG: nucleotidyltransferase domain-containing protein [Geminicoccaceae bacterium]